MKHKILARYPLKNPRRLWAQDNFILSNFSARGNNMRKVIRNCAAAGFNTLEIGWATPEQAEEAVAYCEQLGINLIYQNLHRYGGMQGNRYYQGDALHSVIRELQNWKCIYGYYIWDEPHLDDQISQAAQLVNICEKEAPDKLPFTVAIPSYNELYTWDNELFPQYLEKYVTVIDPPQLSLDYYPIGLPNYHITTQLDNSRMWCDLGLMKKLGHKYDMPLWFYYQGQNLHKAKLFTFPMVRSMMYAGALYGAKGLQHFTAVGSIIDQDGERAQFFEAQKAIHEEFKNLGETLMALDCKRVIHDTSVDPNCAMYKELHERVSDSTYLSKELPERISVSEFGDEYGNGYMMILNRDYMQKKSVVLALNDKYRVYEVSKEDGLQYLLNERTDALALTLDEGDATLIRLQKTDEEAYTIEYRLKK